jgi:sRNA-binding protein
VTSESETAGAPEYTGTAGPNVERLEGLTNTKSQHDVATLLRTVAELFPVFAAERWQVHKPLAIGIDKALIATGILKPLEVRLVLRAYCQRRMYVAAVAAAGARYDIAGNVAGEVSEEHQACAKASLARMDAKRAAQAAEIRADRIAAQPPPPAAAPPPAQLTAPAPPAQPAAPPPRPHIQPPRSGESAPPPQPRRDGLAALRAAAAARRQANTEATR